MYTSKKEAVEAVITAYVHDYDAEGDAISKRRLWYILKPTFDKLDLSHIINRKTKLPVDPVTNADYNKVFNALAGAGEIDDTFISDNSRVCIVGTLLPKIILAVEKSTVDTSVIALAEDLGISCYIAKGFSSIYAAKGLISNMETTLDFEPYTITDEILSEDAYYSYIGYSPEPEDSPLIVLNMTDYDKSGLEISTTIEKHFAADEAYRVLLTPEQIPDDKQDEYFDVTDELGKCYELDVLNRKQLREIFLASIPAHVSDLIVSKNNTDTNLSYRDDAVVDAVNDDADVLEFKYAISELEATKADIEKPFAEQIAELEKQMADATVDVDDELEIEQENLDSLKLELLPKYVEAYDNSDVLEFADATAKDVADDVYIHYSVDDSWSEEV